MGTELLCCLLRTRLRDDVAASSKYVPKAPVDSAVANIPVESSCAMNASTIFSANSLGYGWLLLAWLLTALAGRHLVMTDGPYCRESAHIRKPNLCFLIGRPCNGTLVAPHQDKSWAAHQALHFSELPQM